MQNNNYKLTLKKDWMLILGVVIGVTSILIFMFYFLKGAVALDKRRFSSGNEEKIALFNKQVTLVCTQTSGVFSNALLVNEGNGWKVFHKKYFQKEEQLINIVNCSQKGEQ